MPPRPDAEESQAVRELGREHADDPRFTTIAALVLDVEDERVAAA